MFSKDSFEIVELFKSIEGIDDLSKINPSLLSFTVARLTLFRRLNRSVEVLELDQVNLLFKRRLFEIRDDLFFVSKDKSGISFGDFMLQGSKMNLVGDFFAALHFVHDAKQNEPVVLLHELFPLVDSVVNKAALVELDPNQVLRELYHVCAKCFLVGVFILVDEH